MSGHFATVGHSDMLVLTNASVS